MPHNRERQPRFTSPRPIPRRLSRAEVERGRRRGAPDPIRGLREVAGFGQAIGDTFSAIANKARIPVPEIRVTQGRAARTTGPILLPSGRLIREERHIREYSDAELVGLAVSSPEAGLAIGTAFRRGLALTQRNSVGGPTVVRPGTIRRLTESTRRLTQKLKTAEVSDDPIDAETFNESVLRRRFEIRSASIRSGLTRLAQREGIKQPKPIRELREGLTEDLNLTIQDFSTLLKAPLRSGNPLSPRTFTAFDVMSELLLAGRVPTRSEALLLREFYGTDMANTLMTLAGKTKKEGLLELINIPRALLATLDLSGTLRQGAILTLSRPNRAIRPFKAQIKAWLSQDAAEAEQVRHNMRTFKGFGDMSGLFHATEANPSDVFYGANLLKKVPGLGDLVRRSERSFHTYLNALRDDVFDQLVTEQIRAGRLDSKNMSAGLGLGKDLARFVNAATGHGTIPEFLAPIEPILNAAFFSPRLLFSRFEVPAMMLKSDIRRTVAMDLVRFVGTGSMALGLMKAAGADVETDPRSPDFGKGRVGNVRLDFWGGYGQIARYTAQAAFGEAKSVGTGEVFGVSRKETIFRFLRSKLAPVPGLITDLHEGETFVGEEFFPSSDNAINQIIERTTPLFIQDVIEAAILDGTGGALLAAPAIFGVGATAFTTSGDVANEEAIRLHSKPFNKLSIAQKRAIMNLDTVRQAKIEQSISKASNVAFTLGEDAKTKLDQLGTETDIISGNPAAAAEFERIFNDVRRTNAIEQEALRLDSGRDIEDQLTGNIEDDAIINYLGWFDSGEITDRYGQINFDALEARMETLSEQELKAIEEFTLAGVPDSLKPFVELKQELRRMKWHSLYKTTPTYRKASPAFRSFLDEAMDADRKGNIVQFALGTDNPEATRRLVQNMRRISSEQRLQLRAQNPDLDFRLWRWRGSGLASFTAQRRAVRFLRSQGVNDLDIIERVIVSNAGRHIDNDFVIGLPSIGITTLEQLANASVFQLTTLRDSRTGLRYISSATARGVIQQARRALEGA